MKRVWVCAVVLCLLLGLPGPDLATRGAAAQDKIDPDLLEKFATEGPADYVVRFTEQADLSPAYAMDWLARGEFVYNRLQEAAERSQGRARQMLDQAGLSYRSFIAGNELYVWEGDLAQAQALARLAEVSYIRATRAYTIAPIVEDAPAVPDGPDALAWGISWTGADQFWSAFNVRGDGLVVANIDTGVEWSHSALVGAFKCPGSPGDPACWEDPSNVCGGSACDNNGHGTHTMGTMVADDNPALTWQAGMAPNARWIACKGCEDNNCSDYALNACADWLLAPGGSPANRPHVVNNSWGGGGCNTWYQAKVSAWRAAGIFPAFSAGNEGPDCSTAGSPGDYQESFSSAAHDSGGSVAYFSSRGPSCFGYEPYTKPNIAAPGVAVCSTVPGNGWSCGYSGTSMASPHTAGAVALLWSCNPGLVGQMDLTFQALQSTAAPAPVGNCGGPPNGQGNFTYGYGYLDVFAAGQSYCGSLEFGHLHGYVYDAGSGQPIAGANVSAVPGAGTLAATDPTGYYTMSLIPGSYDVTASRYGYASQTAGNVGIVADAVARQDFSLAYWGEWRAGPGLCFDLTRFDAGYFAGTETVYVLGGRYGDETDGVIYAFDPRTGSCVQTGASMPVPISNYTVNLLNDGNRDLLCTFGGRPAAGGTTGEVQCYDPLSNSAFVVNQMPAGYSSYLPGGQVVLDNRAFIFGGFSPLASPEVTAATYVYDPVANTFTQLGDLGLARGYILAAAVEGYVYAFGGTTFDGVSLVSQVIAERLDPATGVWNDAAVADLPAASGEGQAFGFGSDSNYSLAGQIVLAGGGQWPGETAGAVLYDVAGNSYDLSFPDLLAARRDHAGALVPLCSEPEDDGLPGMWVFGGLGENDAPPYEGAEFFALPCACTPVDGVSISGPGNVAAGSDAHFSASYTPPGADQVLLSWDNGTVGPAAVYNWPQPGSYHVAVTATNDCGEATDSLAVSVFCQPVEEAAIVGPPSLLTAQTGIYDAAALPVTATPPLTFTWDNGTVGASAAYSWAITGTFAITVAVANPCGEVGQATFWVHVLERWPHGRYLPLLLRGYTQTCVPVEAVILEGPARLPAGREGSFRAYPQPFGASGPIEYAWDNGTAGPNALYSWTLPGVYEVTVTSTNPCGLARQSADVEVFCQPPEALLVQGPPELEAGQMGLYTATYAPITATLPLTLSWDNGVVGPAAVYSWADPGVYTLTVTATNACASLSTTYVVTITEGVCRPLVDVTVAGPRTLITAAVGLYTATYAPPTATLPVTLTWDNGTVGPTAAYSWTAPGTYTLTVTASNPCGQAVGHDSVTVMSCRPVYGAGFDWTPLTPTAYVAVFFEGVASGTLPITYSWEFGEGYTETGQSAMYVYGFPGTYTVTMTATNACGQKVVSHSLVVQPSPCNILLVDDDWNFITGSHGGRFYYTSALHLLGYVYDIWDTETQGDPGPGDMSDYATVIWFTGYAWTGTVFSAQNEQDVAQYLDGGGNLILSSQEYHFAAGGVTPFMRDYLGVGSVLNDVTITRTTGISGSPVGHGLGPYTLVRPDDYEIYWPGPPNEGPFDDEVTARPGVYGAFRYDDPGNANPNSTSFYSDTFATVFLAWPFEWVDTAAERAEILQSALFWVCPPPPGRPPVQAPPPWPGRAPGPVPLGAGERVLPQ